jgi:hypothetical protein
MREEPDFALFSSIKENASGSFYFGLRLKCFYFGNVPLLSMGGSEPIADRKVALLPGE